MATFLTFACGRVEPTPETDGLEAWESSVCSEIHEDFQVVELLDFELSVGDFLHVSVIQQGADVQLRFSDPASKALRCVDSPNGTSGPEELLWIAEYPGRYRLEIGTSHENHGTYGVTTLAQRGVTVRDRRLEEADRAYRKGRFLAKAGDQGSAVHAFERALVLFREPSETYREAVTLLELCKAKSKLREFEPALESCGASAELFRQLGEARLRISALGWIGMIHKALGESTIAAEFFEEAFILAEENGFGGVAALNATRLAPLLLQRGEIRRALDRMRRSEVLVPREPSFQRALVFVNLGECLLRYRQLEGAVEAFDEGLKTYETLLQSGKASREKTAKGMVVALRGRATARAQLRDLEAARLDAGQALAVHRNVEDRLSRALTLMTLGRIRRASNDFSGSRDAFLEALDLFRQLGERRGEAYLWLDLGYLAILNGQPEESVENITTAAELFATVEDRLGELAATARLAESLTLDGRVVEAWFTIRPVLDAIETLRAGAERGDLRLNYFADRQDYFEIAVNALIARHTADPDAGHHVTALKVHERRLARELRDRIAVQSATRVSISELAQTLPANTLGLVYALGDERSLLWAISSERIRVFELAGRRYIEPLAKGFLNSLSTPKLSEREPLETRAERLSQALLGPLATVLRNQNLLIVGDGILGLIPFAALKHPSSPQRYLVERHDMVKLPSLTTWHRLIENRQALPPQETLAVLADPVFSADDPRVAPQDESWHAAKTDRVSGPDPTGRLRAAMLRTDPLRTGTALEARSVFQRLEGTQDETEEILKFFPADQNSVWTGFEATRERLLRLKASRLGILHLATHALPESITSEPGVVLSMVDEAGEPRAGFVHASEISRLDLPLQLVVLSACQTAAGEWLRGEGVLSLSRAFFEAGAVRVLASLWSVSDRRTSGLMSSFYQGYRESGLSPAVALRQTQMHMLTQPETAQPFYWAAFELQGLP